MTGLAACAPPLRYSGEFWIRLSKISLRGGLLTRESAHSQMIVLVTDSRRVLLKVGIRIG